MRPARPRRGAVGVAGRVTAVSAYRDGGKGGACMPFFDLRRTMRCPAACCPYEVKNSSPRGDRDLGPYLGGRSKRSEALGHVRKGKASSGTLLIVRQLCSDTRFTSQSNRGQRGIP